MVTHEVATTVDMIWAELLKESQHGLSSIGSKDNQLKIALT